MIINGLIFWLGMEVADSGSEYTEVWGNYYPASFNSERAFAMMDQYLTGTTTINGGLSSNAGTPNRLNSYFGRANYSLLDKYLFTATFRADGSSRFAPIHRWGIFPRRCYCLENVLKNHF